MKMIELQKNKGPFQNLEFEVQIDEFIVHRLNSDITFK